MRSKRSGREEARSTIARLLERGEDAIGVFADELFSNRSFTDQLSRTLGRAADAKKRVDKNMQAVLSALNVPSRADYQRLLTKIEALQGSLVNVGMKLDRVLAAQQEMAAAARHRAPGTHAGARRTSKRRASHPKPRRTEQEDG
jgi:hypothetical protein